MTKPERNNPFYIVKAFVRKLYSWIIIFAVMIKSMIEDFGTTVGIYIILGILVLLMAYSWVKWRKTTFYFKESSIIYQTGVISITKREINFEKVNTVDLSQGFWDKVFGFARLKVDTGSLNKGENELELLLSKERAEEIRSMIFNKGQEAVEEIRDRDIKYRVEGKQLVKYAFVSDAIMGGIGLIFIAVNFVDDFVEDILNIDVSKSVDLPEVDGIYSIVGLILVLLLISTIFSVIGTFVKYYNFRLFVEDGKLNIKYGLFSDKSYSFSLKKVKGIHIKQNPFMQFVGLRTLKVESIGYGDEEEEEAILYPICNLKLQNELISDLLPDLKFQGELEKPPKRALFKFIIKKVIFWGTVAGVATYYLPYGYLAFILVALSIGSGILEYRNTRLGISDGLIYTSSNGFYKSQSLMKMKAVQSIRESAGLLQRSANLSSYIIRVFANDAHSRLKVKNLEKNALEDKLEGFK